MKIYTVVGETGQYEDHCEWTVCAYYEKERAKEHAKLADDRALELSKKYKHNSEIPKGANEYDPLMYMDYIGTDYSVGECELVDSFKEFIEKGESNV